MAGSYDGDFQFVSKAGQNDGGNVEIEKSLTVGGNVIADGDGMNQDLIPSASDEIAGKVKIGNGIDVDSNGEISLTPATDQQLGGITPGEGLATDQDGKLDFTGVFGGVLYVLEDDQETGGGIVAQNSVTVAGNLIADGNGLNLELIPIATDEIAGKVKIGNGISVLSDGTIYLTVEPAAASDFTAHLANPDAHGAGSTPGAGKIVQWNEDGNLESGTPTEENEVTTRGFIAEFFRTTTLSIKARTGAVVKIKIGNNIQSINADEDGFVNLETQHQGDCEISATYEGIKVGRTVNFILYQYNKYEIDLEIPDFVLYGVRHYIDNSATALTRLADSANFTFTPENENQFGTSSFDDGPIFSEIRICDVDFVNGEMVVVYEGEEGFTRTPESGDVCVEIPKFYFWRNGSHRSDSTAYDEWYISDKKINNDFRISPGHMDRGDGNGEKDKFYIGCYPVNSDYRSISGSQRVHNSLDNFRTRITNRGAKYSITDVWEYATIDILWLILVANLNSDTVGIGYTGTYVSHYKISGFTDDIFYHTGRASDFPLYAIPYTRSEVTKFSEGSYFWNNGLQKANQAFNKTTASGDASKMISCEYNAANTYNEGDLVEYKGDVFRCLGTNVQGSTPEEGDEWTGKTETYSEEKNYKILDGVIYNGNFYFCKEETSGAFDATKWNGPYTGSIPTKFLGIENLWGNGNIYEDGVLGNRISSGLEYWIAKDKRGYGNEINENYQKYPLLMTAQNAAIKKIDFSEGLEEILVPLEVGNGASGNKYFCDYFSFSSSNGIRVRMIGGALIHGSVAGKFLLSSSYATAGENVTGARVTITE